MNAPPLLFHHIGIATKNLAQTKKIYEKLGLIFGETIHVPRQKVNVCFSRQGSHPQIELIEPAAEDSPINNILDLIGTTPYHFCYKTDDLGRTSAFLRDQGFLIMNDPGPSNALNENRICFYYHKHLGVVEVVEIRDRENT